MSNTPQTLPPKILFTLAAAYTLVPLKAVIAISLASGLVG